MQPVKLPAAALCTVIAVFLAVGLPCRAASQETAPAQSAPASAASATRTTTKTVTAVLMAVDAERKTVRLKPTEGGVSGGDLMTTLDPECEYTRKGAAAMLGAFVSGERVVARLSFRTSPQQVVILRELWDEASYLAERQTRTELCVGRVASATPGAIEVQRERDGARIAFRVTEKTRIFKFDKAAPLEAFPIGEKVVVKPRGLPGGGVMATIIGGTTAEVTAAYLDTLIRWEGTIHAVDPEAIDGPIVTLLRSDGASRRILLVAGANLKQGRKMLTPATIPTGAAVRVHLVRNREKSGMPYADEITVVTRRDVPGEHP